MIVDNLIKYFEDKNTIVNKKRKMKERLDEICIYLKHIHTVTKATWLKAREDLKCS